MIPFWQFINVLLCVGWQEFEGRKNSESCKDVEGTAILFIYQWLTKQRACIRMMVFNELCQMAKAVRLLKLEKVLSNLEEKFMIRANVLKVQMRFGAFENIEMMKPQVLPLLLAHCQGNQPHCWHRLRSAYYCVSLFIFCSGR